MKIRSILIIVTILITFFQMGSAYAAVIVMQNGDRLTGAIEETTTEAIFVTTKYGRLQLPLSDVLEIKTQTEAIQPVSAYRNPYMPTEAEVAVKRKEKEKAELVKSSEKGGGEKSVESENDQKGWLNAKWSGRVNLGASLQTGNTEQNQINSDSSIKARWEKHRGEIKLDYNREENDGDITEDNRSLEGLFDYFINDKWFLNMNAKYEEDDVDDLDSRITAGFGLGHQFFESDDLNLKYILGPSYLREDNTGQDVDQSIAARWSLDYDQKFLDGFYQAFHEHSLLVPGDNTDAYVFDSSTGLRVPIVDLPGPGKLVSTAQVDFEWENEPAPGTKEDDTTYSLKLGYEW